MKTMTAFLHVSSKLKTRMFENSRKPSTRSFVTNRDHLEGVIIQNTTPTSTHEVYSCVRNFYRQHFSEHKKHVSGGEWNSFLITTQASISHTVSPPSSSLPFRLAFFGLFSLRYLWLSRAWYLMLSLTHDAVLKFTHTERLSLLIRKIN